MPDILKGFILQIQFLTRIPLPVKIPYEERLLIKGFPLIPLAGFIIGLGMAGSYYLAALCGYRLISVMASLCAWVLLTGALHLDGFADTCDGLYSSRDREKILAIMKDPRTGVMGVTGLILLFMIKGSVLLVLHPALIVSCLICLPVTGRLNAVWLAGISGYAGESRGMGAVYAEQCGKKQMVTACLAGLVVLLPFSGYRCLAPLLITILCTTGFGRMLKKRIGGITGDTLGYTIEVSEAVYLVCLLIQETVISNLAVHTA